MISFELTTWAVVLLAPPGAAAVVYGLRRWAPPILPWALILAGVVFLVLAGGAAAAVRFMSGGMNLVALWIIYSTYCVLAFATGLIGRPLIRWPLQILSFAPIACGYFLGTIGLLGLLFLVGAAVEPPVETRRLGGGLVCRIINLDAGPGTGGHYADIYRAWAPLPLGLRVSRRYFRYGVEPACEAPGRAGGA